MSVKFEKEVTRVTEGNESIRAATGDLAHRLGDRLTGGKATGANGYLQVRAHSHSHPR